MTPPVERSLGLHPRLKGVKTKSAARFKQNHVHSVKMTEMPCAGYYGQSVDPLSLPPESQT